MAYQIADTAEVEQTEAARILIYGPPGIGKTSLAAQFPKHIFIDLEGGVPKGVKITAFRDGDGPAKFQTIEQVKEALTSLLHDDHDRLSLVIDSVTKIEKLIWQGLCRKNKWATIESPGYGKGYKEALGEWNALLELLNEIRVTRKMMIVLVGHQKISDFNDTQLGPYSRAHPDVHKEAATALESDMDAIFWLAPDRSITELKDSRGTIATGGTMVWMHTDRNPAYVAKNRFGMPEKILLPAGEGWDLIKKHVPNPHKKG